MYAAYISSVQYPARCSFLTALLQHTRGEQSSDHLSKGSYSHPLWAMWGEWGVRVGEKGKKVKI